MSKLLFHEGEYDGDILHKVIDGMSSVQVIRANGKHGLSEYLVHFHGKDLMKQLGQKLGSSFSGKSYYRYALDHFDYTQFPDLVELRGWIAR